MPCLCVNVCACPCPSEQEEGEEWRMLFDFAWVPGRLAASDTCPWGEAWSLSTTKQTRARSRRPRTHFFLHVPHTPAGRL